MVGGRFRARVGRIGICYRFFLIFALLVDPKVTPIPLECSPVAFELFLYGQPEFSLGGFRSVLQRETLGPVYLYMLETIAVVLILGFVFLVLLLPLDGGPVVGTRGWRWLSFNRQITTDGVRDRVRDRSQKIVVVALRQAHRRSHESPLRL
jgi:hypothetical protein